MIELYFDSALNTHFFTGENICCNCREEILQKGIYVSMTCLQTERIAPKQYRHSLILKNKLYCHDCVCKKKKIYEVIYWVEIREVTIQTFPPLTAIPVVVKPNRDVKDSRDLMGVLSTWVATSNKGIQSNTDSVETLNHCRIGLQTWSDDDPARIGATASDVQIGKSENQIDAEIGEKNKELSFDELDVFLLEQTESVPAVAHDEKKRLSCD